MYLTQEWLFFRSRTYEQGNVLDYVNDYNVNVNYYNCNKSCLGTCYSTLVPLITQQQYILPRDIAQTLPGTHSPWLILCQSYLRMYGLGKGLVKLSVLRYSFYLFSAASWKVYNALLNLAKWVLFLPSSDVYVRSFLCPFISIKSLLHKALSDWDCIFGSGVKPSETTNSTPTTISYQPWKG